MLCKALDITPEQGDLEGDCCICKKHTYWDSTKATMCIVPKNQIKEAILNGKNI